MERRATGEDRHIIRNSMVDAAQHTETQKCQETLNKLKNVEGYSWGSRYQLQRGNVVRPEGSGAWGVQERRWREGADEKGYVRKEKQQRRDVLQ